MHTYDILMVTQGKRQTSFTVENLPYLYMLYVVVIQLTNTCSVVSAELEPRITGTLESWNEVVTPLVAASIVKQALVVV